MRQLRALTIRARIALFGTSVVVVAVLAFGGLVDFLFERSAYASQDQVLQSRTQQVVRPAGGRPPRSGIPRLVEGGRAQVPVDIRTSGDTFMEFVDASARPLFSTGEVDGRPPRLPSEVLADASRDGSTLATITDSGLRIRVAVRPLVLPRPPGGSSAPPATGDPTGSIAGFVVVGQPAARIAAEVDQLRLYLLLAASLILALALLASWVVAGRALRPLDDMTATVEAVGSASDLRRRLPPAFAEDELGRLTGAFNGMMGRLEEAYGRLEESLDSQRRFVADASHELRTPLTTIRSNLGLLLGRGDVTEGDRREALEDMRGESERMSRLVQDLLTLARADAGQALEMNPLDLPAELADVCRQARLTYPGSEVTFEAGEVPTFRGNADSLRQLLWILVDNAARHLPERGRVEVVLGAHDGAVLLTVSDDGVGIAEAEREKVFERFYRSDRARVAGGAGLGLSIARWIVQQHGGRISAAANPGGRGALLRVELPQSS
ncbi:MAG: ATP-binding protein [Candidatus Dormibacteria bacterium]